VLALHLAVDPGLALDLAVFLMADRETGGRWNDRGGSSLMAVPPSDPVIGFRTPEAPATLGRQQVVDALERGWTDGATRAERFDLFRALPDDARHAWLGHCIAMTLEASLNHPGGRACALHDHLGRVLGVEVARWWRPTGANYFDRVPKSVALAALEEVGGQEFTARYAKAKKPELAQACERLFAGELVVEAEVRAAALAWVPEPMRFASPAEPLALADDGAERKAASGALAVRATDQPEIGDGEPGEDQALPTIASDDADGEGPDGSAAEVPGGSVDEGDTSTELDGGESGSEPEALEEAA
jgi:ParB family chromosome partitioning protein